jgi:hypothetical protein
MARKICETLRARGEVDKRGLHALQLVYRPLADSQVPWGVEALSGKISEPSWKAKPSWYLIATDDKMIPPDAQRSMAKRAGSTVMEAKGQPCHLRVAARGCRSSYQTSCQECEDFCRRLVIRGYCPRCRRCLSQGEDGCPTQSRFWLEWSSSTAGQSLPAALSWFAPPIPTQS